MNLTDVAIQHHAWLIRSGDEALSTTARLAHIERRLHPFVEALVNGQTLPRGVEAALADTALQLFAIARREGVDLPAECAVEAGTPPDVSLPRLGPVANAWSELVDHGVDHPQLERFARLLQCVHTAELYARAGDHVPELGNVLAQATLSTLGLLHFHKADLERELMAQMARNEGIPA